MFWCCCERSETPRPVDRRFFGSVHRTRPIGLFDEEWIYAPPPYPPTVNRLWIGWDADSRILYHSGIHHLLEVGQGQTITSATLRLKYTDDVGVIGAVGFEGAVPVLIYLRKADHSPLATEGLTGMFSAAIVTPPIATHFPADWYGPVSTTLNGDTTVNITSIVQQLLNRPGWVSGNYFHLAIVTSQITTGRKLWASDLFNDPDTVVVVGPNEIATENFIDIVI